MSYDNPRIKDLSASPIDIIVDFSEGNPGAIRAMTDMMKDYSAIDPDSVWGNLTPLFDLDNLDFYGSKIWIFYKDMCNMSVLNCAIIFRAIQFGIIPSKQIEDSVNGINEGRYERTNVDFQELLYEIQEKLPAFGKMKDDKI